MTFLTDVVKMGCSEDEVFAIINESEQDRKRRQVWAKTTETVAAYHLREMKDLQAREKLATWRRMNGFDRVADGEDNWFHGPRSLPLTSEEFAASLRSEVNALKDAISMPARTRPWQKTMDFVDGHKEKLPDKELAVIKRYVERRSREAAKVTGTPVSTEQHVFPARPISKCRQMYVLIWRTTRGGWTQSETSLNRHRLARVLKHLDSSVSRTRGHRRKDKPSPTAICLLAWD